MKKLIAIGALVFVFTVCQSHKKASGQEDLLGDVDFTIPMVQRITTAPDGVIENLKKIDSTDTYTSYQPTETEKRLFMAYFELLPKAYKNILEQKVARIFFINNFITAGMTDYWKTEDGNLFNVLYFNPQLLSQPLPDFVAYKDNSYFHDDNTGVTIQIKANTTYYAMLLILLHEASHVYDTHNRVTPFMDPVFENEENKSPTFFTKDIWQNFNTPAAVYNFNWRDKLKPYGMGTTLNKSLAIDIYRCLENTPFVSLYASMNWAEDFAEAFSWAYLKQKFNIDYRVEVLQNEMVVFTLSPLQNELFLKRMEYFKPIFIE